ncbi:MAG: FkbM family methyltransferase [Candidatus Hydrogenedentes bacterium]|nr:FkbM family methyltransferase [Candidatus Hydrogenedentota bacterium]
MIKHQGIWLPDGETHLTEWMTKNGEMVDGRGTYQIKKLRAALAHVKDFRTAVDVGAHVGLWTMQLLKRFRCVHAFEPVAAHRECWQANLAGMSAGHDLTLHACALGDHEGRVSIVTAPTSSGDSRVGGAGDIPLCMLDTFGQVQDVDFIKLDCEGYELFALKGAARIINRDLPVICVEQKPGRGQQFGLPELGAVEWLTKEFGYRCVEKMSGDYVMVPR